MEHLGTIQLETNRLLLRPFRMEDTDAVFDNWASDPEVTRYLTWRAHQSRTVTHDVLESWCRHYTLRTYNWAIILRGTKEPVGNAGLTRINESTRTGEFAYALSRPLWGKGIIPEAMTELLRYWFAEIGFETIVGLHDVRNPASGRVMEKLAMEKGEFFPQAYPDNQGTLRDFQLWRLTKENWENAVLRK